MAASEYQWVKRGNKWVYTKHPGGQCARAPGAGWPLVCPASGVHPDQAGELRSLLAEAGCPTEVTKGGDPVYRSAAHQRRALRIRGMHNRNSFLD